MFLNPGRKWGDDSKKPQLQLAELSALVSQLPVYSPEELSATVSLAPEIWQALAKRHRAQAEMWTLPYRRRRAKGDLHPIHDFLFIYYPFAPSLLERWQPTLGQLIETTPEDASWNPRYYSRLAKGIKLDLEKLSIAAKKRLQWQLTLLKAIDQSKARFACHGLHEWAMLYQGGPDGQARHEGKLPLRVSQKCIDTLIQTRRLCCTHFDAFRFFTPAAQPMNATPLNLMDRAQQEQKGCLHTNMDLYKWTAKAMPWVGADLLLESFLFAIDCREIDMRASPYDCSDYGFTAIPVETSAGRLEYEQAQRALAQRAQAIRSQLIDRLAVLCQ